MPPSEPRVASHRNRMNGKEKDAKHGPAGQGVGGSDAGAAGHLGPLFLSQSTEWLTPPAVIERVLRVFAPGGIDLDPCSDAAHSVPAAHYYTAEQDGLSRDWFGLVYVNPPYGHGVIGQWVNKLVGEYGAGRVTAAIALLPARTDTRWWRRLQPYPVAFVHGRLRFSGHTNSAPFPSALVYLGADVDRFATAFADMTHIRVPYRAGTCPPASPPSSACVGATT